MAGCAVLSKHAFMYSGFLMTLDAVRGCKLELVVLMAVLTGGRQVFSGERETGLVVIKTSQGVHRRVEVPSLVFGMTGCA